LNNDDKRYKEDKALTRSGLLFAGANNALKGKPLPEGVDDGILTAQEISRLDLRGLDLVVLSACETGLGEITGDGVFGLQRGFKKAGAQSILMSLWKVDDTATQMLMTQFYTNLTSGMSKRKSLLEAQRYVREYETEVEVTNLTLWQQRQDQKSSVENNTTTQLEKVRPYEDPKYWAAFILLDALD
jgi:CHAT domain-containing protein